MLKYFVHERPDRKKLQVIYWEQGGSCGGGGGEAVYKVDVVDSVIIDSLKKTN